MQNTNGEWLGNKLVVTVRFNAIEARALRDESGTEVAVDVELDFSRLPYRRALTNVKRRAVEAGGALALRVQP